MCILICTSLHVYRSSIHVYNPPIYIIKPLKYVRIQLFIYMYIYNSLICVYNTSCYLSLSLSCLSFPVFVLFFYLFSFLSPRKNKPTRNAVYVAGRGKCFGQGSPLKSNMRRSSATMVTLQSPRSLHPPCSF